jgi:hypothetical protein
MVVCFRLCKVLCKSVAKILITRTFNDFGDEE